MSNKKEFVKEITNMEEDFAQWYTDIVLKADLCDYSPVKGFMVIKPYGFAIWENIKNYLDGLFKATGHKNLYFPLLIPESLLNTEKEHVEGFAPEVAWVTHGGQKRLPERLCVRPTSETIICSMYAKWLNSYRDLPYLYNQWCSVVRWEKETRPFLRTSEFLWQEGHTLHATEEEAIAETLQMLNCYIDCAENLLAIPVISGVKSEREKFAGAHSTYTIEALMHDGKALQAGTSHHLAQHFTKAFNIEFLDRDGTLKNPYHTSWGVSTRLIGGLIMCHSDNRGLVLPPNVAPTQIIIIPAKQEVPGVLDACNKLYDELKKEGIRVELDDNENMTVGRKFNHYEMKGYPLRIEIGPKDIEKGKLMTARRDTFEKVEYDIEGFAAKAKGILDDIQNNLFERAKKHREEHTYVATDYEQFKTDVKERPGFYKAMWCGCEDCEVKIKEENSVTIRCLPEKQEKLADTCLVCGKPADKMVYLAKAY